MAVRTNKPFSYNNKPLVRDDNTLYFGNRNDKYYIQIRTLESKMVKDLRVGTKLSIELMINDPSKKGKNAIAKRAEREGLYSALDIASVWLDNSK